MSTTKVMVNGVNMLALAEFRDVIKNYDMMDPTRMRLVGFVESRFAEPEHLDRVMHATMFSPIGLIEAKEKLMTVIAEYDRVASA